MQLGHDTYLNPLKDRGFFGDVAWCLYYSSVTQPADDCGRQGLRVRSSFSRFLPSTKRTVLRALATIGDINPCRSSRPMADIAPDRTPRRRKAPPPDHPDVTGKTAYPAVRSGWQEK